MIVACERGRQPIPAAILNKPTLRDELQIYMSAYIDLDSERTHSEGATAIPISAMMRYVEFFEYPDSIVGDFLYLMCALDSANCERIGKQIEEKYKKNTASK